MSSLHAAGTRRRCRFCATATRRCSAVGLTGRDYLAGISNVSPAIVDLVSGRVRTRTVAADIIDELVPIAVTGDTLWVGMRSSSISPGFERVLRYRLPG